MGSSSRFVKSFRIDYERDENWQAYHPYGDSQVVSLPWQGLNLHYDHIVFT